MSTTVSFTTRPSEGASRMPPLLKAVSRFTEWRRKQRAIAALQALDDFHLRDIGLSRCEIWYRVNNPQD